MDTSTLNSAPAKRPPGSEDEKNTGEGTTDKIVIPDECGDTLWEDVLAQNNNLATILNKPENKTQTIAAGVNENPSSVRINGVNGEQ